MLDLVKNVAWPVAAIVISITCLLIVRCITSAKGEFSLGIKDWVKVGTKSGAEPAPLEILADQRSGDAVRGENTADVVSEVTQDRIELDDPVNFWTAPLAVDIENAFERFKTRDSYKEDPEFWEAIKISRLVEVGAGDEIKDFERLSQQNQHWVWPLVFIMRRHMRMQESGEAEIVLKAALARQNVKSRRWALKEGVILYFRFFGTQRALEFIKDNMPHATDVEIGTMFFTLAELNEKKDDLFSSAILSEIALSFDASDKNKTFGLAFNYGSQVGLKTYAFHKYSPLEFDKSFPSAVNNMGVTVPSDDMHLKNDFFERAINFGSEIAAANLARALVHAGFNKRAEEIISQVASDYEGSEMEHVADARAKVVQAKQKTNKDGESVREFAEQQSQRLTSAIRETFKRFKSSGVIHPIGLFETDDGLMTLGADHEGAFCKLIVGQSEFIGRIEAKPFCYEGRITSGTGLLAPHRRLVALWVSEAMIRVFVFPESDGTREEFKIFNLTRVKDERRNLSEAPMPSISGPPRLPAEQGVSSSARPEGRSVAEEAEKGE